MEQVSPFRDSLCVVPCMRVVPIGKSFSPRPLKVHRVAVGVEGGRIGRCLLLLLSGDCS
jgi:hypothetical protein